METSWESDFQERNSGTKDPYYPLPALPSAFLWPSDLESETNRPGQPILNCLIGSVTAKDVGRAIAETTGAMRSLLIY